jgi:hypothetical protein
MKTLDKLSTDELGFIEFEHRVFGYGGEPHVLRALKSFCEVAPLHSFYDSEIVEHALTPPVAWLLINTLSHADMIERGTSMRIRFTDKGVFLAEFVRARSVESLVALIADSAKRCAGVVRFGGISSKGLKMSADFSDPIADDDLL